MLLKAAGVSALTLPADLPPSDDVPDGSIATLGHALSKVDPLLPSFVPEGPHARSTVFCWGGGNLYFKLTEDTPCRIYYCNKFGLCVICSNRVLTRSWKVSNRFFHF